jgi:multiple sugar transport system ATP-binding protein
MRPEHIEQGASGAFGKDASVVRVEHLGDQTRLHLTLEGHAILTLSDVHTDLEPGDAIAIQPRNPLYFAADGSRIGGPGR